MVNGGSPHDRRKATKWRFPTGECDPKSRWITADRRHPLVVQAADRSVAGGGAAAAGDAEPSGLGPRLRLL